MDIIQTKSIAEQVDEILLKRIREGVYLAGSRIPSESDLSDELGVSRATIRTALAKLSANGMIIRKQGDGTYVNVRVQEIMAHTGSLWDLSQLIENNGYTPSIRSTLMERRSATEKEALSLALEPGDELLSLRRLFLADQQPVVLAHNVIPFSLLREPMENIDAELPIREIFERYCHQKIAFAVTDIRSALLEPEILEFLGGKASGVILHLQVAFYGKNNLPLALGEIYFNDSILRLSLVQAWS